MRRVMGKVSDETYTQLPKILPHGSQESILGLVIEDFVKWCDEDPNAALRYVARELKLKDGERISITRDSAIDLLEGLNSSRIVTPSIISACAELRKELKLEQP